MKPDASDCGDRMNVLSSVSRHMHRLLRTLPLLTGLGLFVALGAVGCQKVPLLAPSGTVINLTVASEAVGLNSSVDVVAVLIENGTTSTSGTGTGSTAAAVTGAGTPVQDGTLVSFTTSIGTIQPADARTTNGRVTVKFTTGTTSGTATITAYSGGARSTATIKIGAANVKTVTVSATPQNLASTGGQATVTARVDDVNGNGVTGVPVEFSTTKGTLSATTATTNGLGIATTTLTTTAAADVTASIAGVTGKVSIGVATRATVSVSGPSSTVSVSSPATFSINVGTTVPVTNVVINYGDGQSKGLGTLSGTQSVTHFYSDSGIYDVTVSATDPDGVVTTASTQVAITNLTGTVTASPTTAENGTTVVSFTATVLPSGASIDHYLWTFNDGTTAVTSFGNTQTHVFKSGVTPGIYTVSVEVFPLYGRTFTMTLQIKVT